jgi:hypothetical protein
MSGVVVYLESTGGAMKKQTRYAVTLIAVGALALGLCGCGSGSQGKTAAQSTVQETQVGTAAAASSESSAAVSAQTAAVSSETSSQSTSAAAQTESSSVTASDTASESASGSELAFFRDYKAYQVYYLFNTDDKTVKYMSTQDGKVLDGTYTGDIKTGAEITYASDSSKTVQFQMEGKEGDMAMVTDSHGFGSPVFVAEVSDVEAALNKQ